MTCNDCEYFVNDTKENPDNYKHETAKRTGKGFCLMQLLFTEVKPTDQACNAFEYDKIKESFELSEIFGD